MPLDEFESDDGVVIKEQDGQGPNHYTVYKRTGDNRPWIAADRVEIGHNAAIVYGKAVLFDAVRVEKYPYKGQTRARVTPMGEE